MLRLVRKFTEFIYLTWLSIVLGLVLVIVIISLCNISVGNFLSLTYQIYNSKLLVNLARQVLGGLVVSKFGIWSQVVTFVWVQLPQVAMLKTCPNMTLAVEQNIKPWLWPFARHSSCTKQHMYFWYILYFLLLMTCLSYSKIYNKHVLNFQMWILNESHIYNFYI